MLLKSVKQPFMFLYYHLEYLLQPGWENLTGASCYLCLFQLLFRDGEKTPETSNPISACSVHFTPKTLSCTKNCVYILCKYMQYILYISKHISLISYICMSLIDLGKELANAETCWASYKAEQTTEEYSRNEEMYQWKCSVFFKKYISDFILVLCN